MNDVETIRPPFDPAVLYKALFLAVMATFVLVPLLATVLGGFKSLGELRVNPFGLPHQWEWSNYADILFSGRYWQLLRNSLSISTLTVALTLIVASVANARPESVCRWDDERSRPHTIGGSGTPSAKVRPQGEWLGHGYIDQE